jgi:hypothetical protein
MSTRTATLDWPGIARRADRDPWARAIVDSLAGAFDVVDRKWPGDPPTEQSEWTHHYFCDDDASRLTFDLASPSRHACPRCGREYAGLPWDGSWRTIVHGTIAAACERAAVLARLRPADPRSLQFLRRIVLFYADHYADYAVHGVRAGKGKIMPQSLDEAILIITLGRCIEWGRDASWFDDAELEKVRRNLFAPAVDLLRPQIFAIHNIHQWLNASVAMCARVLGDGALLSWTIDSPTGFRAQLDKGTNADGFWFEGSMTYHYYTFNALLAHALTALVAGIDVFDDDPKFARMLSAPLGLMYPNGRFPAHNDCWPGVTVPVELYEVASWAWPEASFARDLGGLYRARGPGESTARLTQSVDRIPAAPTAHARASVHALLWGRDDVDLAAPSPRRASRRYAASGIAILEHDSMDLRLCLRAGPDGGGHDHRDKLNVDVFANGTAIAPDLGTSGYAAKITGAWYRTAAAHNVVVIDGARQEKIDGAIESFDERSVVAVARGVVPGVNGRRSIDLTPSGWRDTVEVEADRDVRADYFFHALGALSLDVPTGPAVLGEGNGYAWPRKVRSATARRVIAAWTSAAGTLRATVDADAEFEVFTAEADDNPADASRPMGVLVVRRRGGRARFVVNYTFEPARSTP